MKIGRNHPCPCGSGKKYKKCCIGTLPDYLEKYYGLVHQEGVIKNKLMAWAVQNFTDDELDQYAQEFNGEKFHPLMEKGGGSISSFFDWFFLEAVHKDEKIRILEVIRGNFSDFFEGGELEIIDEWINHTQAGIYVVREVDEKKHHLVIQEIFTGKKYDIMDVKGSTALVEGDVFFARVQEIFSQHYLSGALASIPRLNLERFKEFIQQHYKEAEKRQPSLEYEKFINCNGRIVNDFLSEPPQVFSSTGEPVKVCETVYSADPKDAAKIMDSLLGNKKYLVTNEKYNNSGVLKEMEISRVGKEQRPSEDKGGIVSNSFFLSGEGKSIQTVGSISFREGKLRVFSLSESVYEELKGKVEEVIGLDIIEEREERKSIQQVWEEMGKSRVSEEKKRRSKEEKEAAITFFENYYREWCDMEIPALGNKTPRQMIKTEEGKIKMRELLLDIQNTELHKKKRGEAYVPVEEIIRKELDWFD